MGKFDQVADDAVISQVGAALEKNNITAIVVNDKKQALKNVIELIPKGAEVFTMTSVTLEATGIANEINNSGNYNSVRNKLSDLGPGPSQEKSRLGTAPEWAIGSVHALTEEGHLFIASNTGSQLAAEVYGAAHVVYVVGAQKIVKHNDAAIKRIYEYVLPLEDKRLFAIYKVHSFVSKLLIINKEVAPNRITVVIVKEKLGF